MKRRHIVLLGILAVLVLATLIYTRPMTLQEIGKVDIAQCESVSGYHRRAPDSEFTSFELSAEDERCSQLIDLFAQQKFRRSLINLLDWRTGFHNAVACPGRGNPLFGGRENVVFSKPWLYRTAPGNFALAEAPLSCEL